jgi:hypothetical protein
MAYISTQKVAEIRNNLKTEFPLKDGWKFSVIREHCTNLSVSIMQAPITFGTNSEQYEQLNDYHLDWYENNEILKRIRQICMEGNHDNSDSQSDYFDVGWYFHLEIGKWNKPFVYKTNQIQEAINNGKLKSETVPIEIDGEELEVTILELN